MTDRRLSLIDALHPDGSAPRLAVHGSSRRPFLPSAGSETVAGGEAGPLDALILAPTEEESGSERWISEAVQAVRHVGDDGLVYVCAPRFRRRRLALLLRREGFVPVSAYTHGRQGPTGHLLVPLDARLVRYLFRVMPSRRWRGAIGRHLPPAIGPAAVRFLTDLGTVYRRPRSRPLMEWAVRDLGMPGAADRTILRHGALGPREDLIVFPFAAGEESPAAVLKIPLTGTSAGARRREGEALDRLADAAREAGAMVPESSLHELPFGPVLRLGVVPGVPASMILERRPARYAEVVAAVGGWLRRWNRLTRAPAEPGWAQREILDPAAEIAPELPDGGAYIEWLRASVSGIDLESVPAVASHNDLTMLNVQIGNGKLGVLDWEAARPDGLPLTDFLYAAADAHAATKRFRDRPAALIEAFDRTTAAGGEVWQMVMSMATELALPAEAAELMRHACVLHHARNDRRKGLGEKPFLRLAAWLASRSGRSHGA